MHVAHPVFMQQAPLVLIHSEVLYYSKIKYIKYIQVVYVTKERREERNEINFIEILVKL
jgi:hypothetical protein